MAFQKAESWIVDEDEKALFSCTNVCETLGFDLQRLREGLTEWKRRKLEEHSKRRSARLN